MQPLDRRRRGERGSAFGNFLTLLLLVGLIGLGAYLYLRPKPGAEAPPGERTSQEAAGEEAAGEGERPAPIEPVSGTPVLEAAGTYVPKDGVLQIDISEYAGYGGLIVANGGLEPNPDSFFAREYGFQVRISMSEEETWSPLNNGRLAATATTVDALAVLGRSFEAVIPVQIGFSRGADMLVVDRGIASVNQLRAGRWPRRSSTRASSSSAISRRRPASAWRCCATWTRSLPRARSAWCSTKTPSSPATRTRTSCHKSVPA
jgi:NitT/TauT family transport system substrate-binding protein